MHTDEIELPLIIFNGEVVKLDTKEIVQTDVKIVASVIKID